MNDVVSYVQSTAVVLAMAFATGCGGARKSAPDTADRSAAPSSSAASSAPSASASAASSAAQDLPTFSGCPGGTQPSSPIEYGLCVLEQAKARAKSTARVAVYLAGDPGAHALDGKTTVPTKPESFAVATEGDVTTVVGRDAIGALYGTLEIAERLEQDGASALPLASPISEEPKLPIRGANLFLVLPDEHEKSWWFYDKGFWTEYLDMMARARLNFLDLHGMYNLKNTVFPNALLYFATAASKPEVGVSKEERDKNAAMLNDVVAMARLRGVEVGLMSYRADFAPLGDRNETDDEYKAAGSYTKEAVIDLATKVPGLKYLGFRVGDSHEKPEFYKDTFVEALKEAKSGAVVYTRSWLAKKKDLLQVLETEKGKALLEVKYNGEHLGPPYVIAGGGMQDEGSYSYEDLLTPPTPYRFVFQVRAGGTNRMLRYASYERTRRAVVSMTMSPKVDGFTLEAAHAYWPQRDRYHAKKEDSFSKWTWRRDELAYLLFGRLGYDPKIPESVFRGMLKLRTGTDGLWQPVQAASDIVPWAETAMTCGPDQRNYAAEEEVGGPVAYWAAPWKQKAHWPTESGKPETHCPRHGTFDEFAVALPAETAEDLVQGRGTSRITPIEVADAVLADAKEARKAKEVTIRPTNPEARDYQRECLAYADLGEWLGHKLRAATALAVYERSADAPWLDAAKDEAKTADAAWDKLAEDTAYIAPFEDPLRMSRLGYPEFHWKKEAARNAADLPSIDDAAAKRVKPKVSLPAPKVWLEAPRKAGPGLAALTIMPEDPKARSWKVTATLGQAVPKGTTVRILHRGWKSTAPDWAAVDATGSGATWTATVPGGGEGGMFAVDVDGPPGEAWRYPDMMKETPYRVLAP